MISAYISQLPALASITLFVAMVIVWAHVFTGGI